MRVSVIICTKNRAVSLEATIQSLRRVVVPSGWDADLVVVDNGSSDHTRAVVEGAMFGGRRAAFYVEAAPGVASARNRGLEVAAGDVLLWTDDDVRLPVDWMRAMVAPIAEGRMDAVAGGVRLGFGRERYWMGPCLKSWLASSEGLHAERPGRMIGASMAFHRRVLGAAPRFDPALGPGALGMGEETLFSYQIESAGFRIGTSFRVQVEHAFDPGRLCPSGLARLACSMGRSEAYIAHHWHGVDARGAWSRVMDARARLVYWRLRGRLQRRVPPGLLEGELQALARVHYWQHLQALESIPRLYRGGERALEEAKTCPVGA